ncbi:hypothetical protein ACJROX_18310 [Pseudalkalibacillus sp. A8]|uniref:hypothetical protein n=1 Tax=Pseudalkalibacillus sp. A8 TaxID=3382641 RepID=UPI0038B60251
MSQSLQFYIILIVLGLEGKGSNLGNKTDNPEQSQSYYDPEKTIELSLEKNV